MRIKEAKNSIVPKERKRKSRKVKTVTIEDEIASGALGFGLTLKQNLSRRGFTRKEIEKLTKTF